MVGINEEIGGLSALSCSTGIYIIETDSDFNVLNERRNDLR